MKTELRPNTQTPQPRYIMAAHIAAALLWLLSLPQEVFILSESGRSFDGIAVLVFGTLFGWVYGLDWSREIGYLAVYANYPALLLMLPIRYPGRLAEILLGVMWPLALLTFLLDAVIINEAAHRIAITAYGPGLYLWFAALAAVTFARLAAPDQRPSENGC
ncbi:hypothetical protein [Bergeriella denitrificans]|uniref:Integral membrane protein n=1 Tax=Bergeriella denitrificans TaxID=494 RepID=A0A378UJR3_BERDE|nr:hypothetical protein [Bergeriella denitrificans]STZ76909.1 integral membrane protein [Bergeriella denitrificans]